MKNHWIQYEKKDKKKDERQPMGIGRIGRPDIEFVQKFRWTLKATSLDYSFMKGVDLDFHNKLVKFESYEVIDPFELAEIDVQQWVEKDISEEVMTFTTFDGCGTKLYEYKFYDLKIVADNASFDYSEGDPSLREVTVSYDRYERSVFERKREETK